jgi:hypothetical protein
VTKYDTIHELHRSIVEFDAPLPPFFAHVDDFAGHELESTGVTELCDEEPIQDRAIPLEIEGVLRVERYARVLALPFLEEFDHKLSLEFLVGFVQKARLIRIAGTGVVLNLSYLFNDRADAWVGDEIIHHLIVLETDNAEAQ